MQILKPSRHRGTVTRWDAYDERTGNPLRVTRTIDIDGDEHWSLSIQRGGVWQRLPKYCGRNRDTSSIIKRDFALCLYETEDLPSPEPHTIRRRLAMIEAEEQRLEPSDAWESAIAAQEARYMARERGK